MKFHISIVPKFFKIKPFTDYWSYEGTKTCKQNAHLIGDLLTGLPPSKETKTFNKKQILKMFPNFKS